MSLHACSRPLPRRSGCVISAAPPRPAGDLSFELGVGIELLAPLLPAWFLVIGSLANALKSTSYMMRLPPRAAILKHGPLQRCPTPCPSSALYARATAYGGERSTVPSALLGCGRRSQQGHTCS